MQEWYMSSKKNAAAQVQVVDVSHSPIEELRVVGQGQAIGKMDAHRTTNGGTDLTDHGLVAFRDPNGQVMKARLTVYGTHEPVLGRGIGRTIKNAVLSTKTVVVDGKLRKFSDLTINLNREIVIEEVGEYDPNAAQAVTVPVQE
jgi:hypothetical protein